MRFAREIRLTAYEMPAGVRGFISFHISAAAEIFHNSVSYYFTLRSNISSDMLLCFQIAFHFKKTSKAADSVFLCLLLFIRTSDITPRMLYSINNVHPVFLKYCIFSRSISSLTLKYSPRQVIHINSVLPRFISFRCSATSSYAS